MFFRWYVYLPFRFSDKSFRSISFYTARDMRPTVRTLFYFNTSITAIFCGKVHNGLSLGSNRTLSSESSSRNPQSLFCHQGKGHKLYVQITGKIVTNSRDRVILMKLIVCHLFKFSSFDGYIRFINVLSSLPLVHTLNLINPIHILHLIYVRSTFRVPYNLCLDISGICSLQVFRQKLYTHCFIFSYPPATLNKSQQNVNK